MKNKVTIVGQDKSNKQTNVGNLYFNEDRATNLLPVVQEILAHLPQENISELSPECRQNYDYVNSLPFCQWLVENRGSHELSDTEVLLFLISRFSLDESNANNLIDAILKVADNHAIKSIFSFGHLDILNVVLHSESKNCIARICEHVVQQKIITPLQSACVLGDTEQASTLLEDGAKVDDAIEVLREPNQWGSVLIDSVAPIHLVCAFGHSELAKKLVNHGSSFSFRIIQLKDEKRTDTGGYNPNPLSIAARLGHVGVCKPLVSEYQKSAGVCGRKGDLHDPMETAERYNQVNVVKAILDALAFDSDYKKSLIMTSYHRNQNTALHNAAMRGHVEIVNLFLKELQDLKGQDKRDNWRYNNLDLDTQNKDGHTALALACRYGHVDVVKSLVDAGASFLKIFMFWESEKHPERPLLLASKFGHANVVELLLEREADAKESCETKTLRRPLHLACIFGHTEVVRVLLEGKKYIHDQKSGEYRLNKASEVDCRTSRSAYWSERRYYHYATPLHFACAEGNVEIVELLLKHGANINARSENGDTALTIACLNGNIEVVRTLLEHGVDPSIGGADIRIIETDESKYLVNRINCSPIEIACMLDLPELAKLLLNYLPPEKLTDIFYYNLLEKNISSINFSKTKYVVLSHLRNLKAIYEVTKSSVTESKKTSQEFVSMDTSNINFSRSQDVVLNHLRNLKTTYEITKPSVTESKKTSPEFVSMDAKCRQLLSLTLTAVQGRPDDKGFLNCAANVAKSITQSTQGSEELKQLGETIFGFLGAVYDQLSSKSYFKELDATRYCTDFATYEKYVPETWQSPLFNFACQQSIEASTKTAIVKMLKEPSENTDVVLVNRAKGIVDHFVSFCERVKPTDESLRFPTLVSNTLANPQLVNAEPKFRLVVLLTALRSAIANKAASAAKTLCELWGQMGEEHKVLYEQVQQSNPNSELLKVLDTDDLWPYLTEIGVCTQQTEVNEFEVTESVSNMTNF